MPIADADIINVDQKPLNAAEAFYLPEVFKGLGTTFKHMAGSVGKWAGAGKHLKTMEYPEERREHRPLEDGGLYVGNFRGVHRLNRDEQGRVRCVACMMCATACPANCIHIEGKTSPWDDREKYPVKFDIDILQCVFCGLCVEACPCDAIRMDTGKFTAAYFEGPVKILDIDYLLHNHPESKSPVSDAIY